MDISRKMKTKRRGARWFRRQTQKALKYRQKGGLGWLVKAFIGALALGLTPSALASSGPSPRAGPNFSGALVNVSGPRNMSFGAQPSYMGALMPRGQQTGMMMASNQFVNFTQVPTSPNFPANPFGSATPMPYVTPPAIPGPVAEFVKPLEGIIENASQGFLKGAIELTQDMVTSTVKAQHLNEGVTMAGHNTLTTTSMTRGLVSANQHLSLDQYLNNCATTSKCFLDIDMWKSRIGNTVYSIHGNPYLSTFLNRSEGSWAGSQAVLNKVHDFARNHPDVTFTIRSENHEVSAKDVDAMLTPDMKAQVATFSKHNMPTHGELQEKGTNVMYFLENADQTQVDQATGIFTDSVVMAQDHYFIRTHWDDIKGLRSGDDIGEHMGEIDTAKLPANPMILIDGYQTSIGADPTGHAAQTEFVGSAVSEVLPRIIEHARSKGVDVSDTTGCIVMLDHIDSSAFSLQVALDNVNNVEDPAVRDVLMTEITDYYLSTQQALAQELADPSARPTLNSFAHVIRKVKGKNATVDFADVSNILTTLTTAGLGIIYMYGAIKGKYCQMQGYDEFCRKIEFIIEKNTEEHPEMRSVAKMGEKAGHLLTKIKIPNTKVNEDPSAPLISSNSLESLTPKTNTSNIGSPTSINSGSPRSPGKTKGQKKKEREQRKKQQGNNAAFLAWGQKRGGKTRRRR